MCFKLTKCLTEAQIEGNMQKGSLVICNTVVAKWEQPRETSAQFLLLTLLMGKPVICQEEDEKRRKSKTSKNMEPLPSPEA